MSKVNVFNHNWIDLVFEGRNQSYGAYQLRKDDSKTTMLALFSGIGLMALAVAIPVGINYFSDGGQAVNTIISSPITPVELTDEPVFKAPVKPIAEPPKPQPRENSAPAAPASPATPTIEFRQGLEATSGPIPDPPNTRDFENSNPGQQTTEGEFGGNLTGVTPGVTGGTGNTPDATAPEGTTDVNMVDVMPLYPGGMEAFYREVGRKYRVPEAETAMVAKVYVSFIIEKDGSMTNVQILRDPNQSLGLGKEALRVLKGMKAQWKPGIKDGKPVRTAYNLPITVKIN